MLPALFTPHLARVSSSKGPASILTRETEKEEGKNTLRRDGRGGILVGAEGENDRVAVASVGLSSAFLLASFPSFTVGR